MASDLLYQGLELMLVGMGTVVVFLTALVGATALMSRVIMRLQSVPASVVDAEALEVAAITAAINEHRRRQRP